MGIKAEEEKYRAIRDKQKEEKSKFYEDMNALTTIRRQKDQSFEDHINENIRAIDKDLADLRARLREIKSLKEEKQIVASIEKTRSRKQQIIALNEQQVSSNNASQKLKDLKEQKKPFLEELRKYQAIISENSEKREACYAQIQAIKEEKKKVMDEINEVNKQVAEKKVVLDEKWTVYRKEQNELREKRKKEQEQRRIQQKKEREEREQQRLAEEASRPPMLKEIEACDAVINYLQRIRFNKKKPNAKLTHSLDAFSLFSEVGMTPPQRGKQVQEAKEQIQKKKEEVLAAQEVAIQKRKEEAAKEAAAEKSAPAEEETKEEAGAETAAAEEPESAPEAKDEAAPEESAPAEEETKEEATTETAAVEEPESAPEVKEEPAAE